MFYIGFFIEKMSNLLIPSFLLSDVSESLRLLTKNEQCEWITQVVHQKWATMSNSLRWLRGNERLWANRSVRSPKMSEWANCRVFFSKSLIWSFLGKKRAIRLENQLANSQPCNLNDYKQRYSFAQMFLCLHLLFSCCSSLNNMALLLLNFLNSRESTCGSPVQCSY